jgi:hypothetical protein
MPGVEAPPALETPGSRVAAAPEASLGPLRAPPPESASGSAAQAVAATTVATQHVHERCPIRCPILGDWWDLNTAAFQRSGEWGRGRLEASPHEVEEECCMEGRGRSKLPSPREPFCEVVATRGPCDETVRCAC